MGYDTASTEDVESIVPEEYGGMWFLREPLNAEGIGVSILELEPGGKGREHDESESRQEEVYCVVEGTVTIELDDESVELGTNEVIRLDPDQTRQIHNTGDRRAKLVLAGAALD